MNNEDKLLVIPSSVVDGIIQYLSVKPWNEVQSVMPILLNLKELPTLEKNESKNQE